MTRWNAIGQQTSDVICSASSRGGFVRVGWPRDRASTAREADREHRAGRTAHVYLGRRVQHRSRRSDAHPVVGTRCACAARIAVVHACSGAAALTERRAGRRGAAQRGVVAALACTRSARLTDRARRTARTAVVHVLREVCASTATARLPRLAVDGGAPTTAHAVEASIPRLAGVPDGAAIGRVRAQIDALTRAAPAVTRFADAARCARTARTTEGAAAAHRTGLARSACSPGAAAAARIGQAGADAARTRGGRVTRKAAAAAMIERRVLSPVAPRDHSVAIHTHAAAAELVALTVGITLDRSRIRRCVETCIGPDVETCFSPHVVALGRIRGRRVDASSVDAGVHSLTRARPVTASVRQANLPAAAAPRAYARDRHPGRARRLRPRTPREKPTHRNQRPDPSSHRADATRCPVERLRCRSCARACDACGSARRISEAAAP